MKNKLFVMLVAIMLLASARSSAQRFVISFDCRSGNYWSGFLGAPTSVINSLLYTLSPYDDDCDELIKPGGFAYQLRFNNIKNDGRKIDYNGHKFFGFKAVDLFRDFEYSMKLGFASKGFPIGVFATVGYKNENFEMKLTENSEWLKQRVRSIRPGIVVQISPLRNRGWGDYNISPTFEVGTTYDKHVNYKGGFNNDKNQINDGISYFFGAGVSFGNGVSALLKFDKQNYNTFNKDFEIDGMKPYEKVKTRHFTLSVETIFAL